MARGLAAVRERGGRLFILGVGGGAGHASHAVNDFRKLCLIESYAPTDNVSELTARTNDDGWDTSFTEWLAISKLSARRRAARVQRRRRLARAQRLGQPRQRDRAAPASAARRSTASSARRAGRWPSWPTWRSSSTPPADLKTPLVESFQAVVWHALVSHPELAAQPGPLGVAGGRRTHVSGARRRVRRPRRRRSTSSCPIRSAAGRSRRCASRTSR